MNLGRNVFNLLKRQTEVYVKGLGSFKRNLTSSAFDDKNNVYLPPIAYLDFNQSSQEGYDFIQYIQQLHEIERSEADHLVSVAVAALKQQIVEEGQAKLDDLGYLLSYGEAYVFKPLDLSGFHLEPVAVNPQFVEEEPSIEAPFVGEDHASEQPHEEQPAVREESLPTEEPIEEQPVPAEDITITEEPTQESEEEVENPALASLLIDEENSEVAEISPAADFGQSETNLPVVEAAPAVDETLLAAPSDIPATAGEESVEEAEFEPRKKSNAIWYIILILVGLGVMAGLYITNNNIQLFPAEVPVDTPVVEVPLVDTTTSIFDVDSTALALQADTALVDTAKVETEKQAPREEVVLTKRNHEWQLVIGTHATLAQAYEQAESYNKAGYPHVRVVPSNLAKNKKKVIWDSYETKDQVDSAALYVKKHIIKDAWQDKINK